MHPECQEWGCQIAEHQGYAPCSDRSGACQNEPRHAPVSRSSSRSIDGESVPEEGRAWWALLLMAAIVVACVLMGD